MINWHVGMKVVCIDDSRPNSGYGDEPVPILDEIYTIRSIRPWTHNYGDKNWLEVFLVECRRAVREYVSGTYEPGFGSFRFKPLEENRTDISVFTSILNSIKTLENV